MSRRGAVTSLMRSVNAHTNCPCHSHQIPLTPALSRPYATPVDPTLPDYAFELGTSTLRYGAGVTREVGMDFKNMGMKKTAVFTDPNIAKLQPVQTAIDSIDAAGQNYVVFDTCRAEPTLESWTNAIEWARSQACDSYLAVVSPWSAPSCLT